MVGADVCSAPGYRWGQSESQFRKETEDPGELSFMSVSDSLSRTQGVKQAAGTASPEPKGELRSKS